MGPLLMTGLACFGSTVGIGLLTGGVSPPAGAPELVARYRVAARGMVIVLAAFMEGIAVIAVVVGLLAIEFGSVADPGDGLYAAVPAIAGAFIGLGLVLSNATALEAGVAAVCAMFIAGLGLLGVVVAGMAVFLVVPGSTTSPGWPFVVLGLISAGAALGIGLTGRRGVRAIPDGGDEALQTWRGALIARATPFQLAAIGASAVAILLVVLGADRP